MPHHLPSLRLETMLQNPSGTPARHTDGDGAPFAWRGDKLLSRGKLWSDVRALARQLPDHAHVINLCADRYLFCLTLLAAMARGQVCLLPPAGLEGILREILRDYPMPISPANKRRQTHAATGSPWQRQAARGQPARLRSTMPRPH